MGEIFLARDLQGSRSTHAGDPDAVPMLVQEARIGAMLEHPNVVRVHELGKQGQTYFIVMEHVRGLSLAQCLQAAGRALPVSMALRIAAEVAEGLTYVHGRTDPKGVPLHLVHRDISPGNILLSTAGAVKIADFGIAKHRWSLMRTQVGVIKGKLSYLAPEQVLHEPVDARTDIYALGLVLYEMTTGRRAYLDDTETAALVAAQLGRFAAPETIVEGFPADVAAVLRRALAFEPGDRYQSCPELREDLLRCLVGRRSVEPADVGRLVRRVMPAVRRPELSAVDTGKVTSFHPLPPAPVTPGPDRAQSRRPRRPRRRARARSAVSVRVGLRVAAATAVGVLALGLFAWQARRHEPSARAASSAVRARGSGTIAVARQPVTRGVARAAGAAAGTDRKRPAPLGPANEPMLVSLRSAPVSSVA